MFKKAWIACLLLLVTTMAAAQIPTRVRGTVRDADTGEPLPFAGVYFDGTSIGISTDLDGHYSIVTRSEDAKVLTAQLLGYESQSIAVSQGSFSEVNFELRQDPTQLAAATVKPDNRYLRSILRKLDSQRSVHDPDNAPDWNSRMYSRMEFDVSNAEDLLKLGVLNRNIGFIQQYADTSAVSGMSYIPAILSENLSDVYHSQDPFFNREVMRASRISGFEEINVLRQYTGSYLLNTNFYKNTIDILSLDIPNPAAASSQVFYNYFLVDSLQVEGRKTYILRFHPKALVTSPTLDGELHIDAEDFGIRSVHAQLSPSSSVNWIRHINIDMEYRRLSDGRWFYGEERLFIDFSIISNDSSKLISLLGNRQIIYEEPVFEPVSDKDALEGNTYVVERNVIRGDDAYWAAVRPFPLTPREQGIYDMVEKIQSSTFYKATYQTTRTLASNYYRVPQWGLEFGRWENLFALSADEGFRLQLGGRTTYHFSEKLRLGAYVAYGFKDKRFKGQGTLEYMFRRDNTSKLLLTFRQDYARLASGYAVFSPPAITSVVTPRALSQQSMVRMFEAQFENEFTPSVNSTFKLSTMRVWSNPSVPFYQQDGSLMDSFSLNQITASLRFSKDERVTRNYFTKTYLYTKYPILELGVVAGIKGITNNDFSFIRPEATLTWKIPSTAIGFGTLRLEGGAIFGAVPYPLLKVHPGNQTFFIHTESFSCMDYYEFASDRWIQGYYEHNFNSFFLGKIPLIKKLDLREVATVRFAWGTISSANWGENAPVKLLPETGRLEKPYVEAGVGISNILKVLRVDCFWRLTHRQDNPNRNFSVNIGLDLKF